MDKRLRVLNVEDSERDVALLSRHLLSAGYDLINDRVDTAASMRAALESKEWDIVLCDYSMPQFNALAALNVLEKSGLDIPLIIISGTVGEDVAVEAMRSGAHDYLMKDNLARLGPAIERELQDAENRRVQRETFTALKASEAEMRALFQAMNDVILVLDSEGRHLKVAPTSPTQYYKQNVHRIGKTVHEIFPPEVADLILCSVRRSLDEARTLHVDYSLAIDGHDVWFDATVTPMTDDSVVWVAREVTERKRLENERRILFEIIQASIAEPDLDKFLKLVHLSISEIVYAENCFVMLHDAAADMFRFEFWVDSRDPQPKPKRRGTGFASYVLRTGMPLRLTKESKKELQELGEAEQIGSTSASWLGVPLRTPLRTIGVLVLQHYEKENIFSGRDLEFLSSVGDQIALAIERKRADDGLRESEALLAASQRITHLGSWVMDLSESDDGKKPNERWSDEHYRIFGFEPGQVEITDEVFYNSVHPDDRERLAATVREAIEQQQPFDIEHRIILPDGSERIVQAMAELVLENNTGKPLKLLGSVQDITERKRNEKFIRESEERYRDLVENAIDMIYTQDLNGNFTSINKAAERITGYTREETLSRNMAESVAPEQRQKIAAQMRAALLSGTDATAYELEIVAKDGGRIAVEVNTRIIYENDLPVGVQGIARDITERKRTEAALEESEASFKALFDTSTDAIMVMSDRLFIDCNSSTEVLFGGQKEDIVGISPIALSPIEQPDGRLSSEKAIDHLDRAMKGEPQFFEWKHLRLDGTPFDAEVSLNKVDFHGVSQIQATVRDISERKLAQKDRELTLQRLNDAQRLGRIGDWEWNVATKSITWSPEVFEIVGRDPLLGPPANYEEMSSSYDAPSREVLDANVSAAMQSGEAQEYELVVVRPDGERVYIQAVAEPRKGEDEQIFALAGTIQDISARKFAEEALTESELRYHSLFENMLEGYAYCETVFEGDQLRDFIYTEVNGAFETLTGLKNVVGKKVSDLIPGIQESNPELFEIYGRVALTGDPEKFETYVAPLDIWLSITIYSSDRGHFVAVFDNITERKLANASLSESEDRYRTLYETSPDGVAMFDLQMNVLMANDQAAEIFGYANSEAMIGKNAYDLMAPENHARAKMNISGIFKSGRLAPLESIGVRADGTKFAVEFSATLISDADGQPKAILGVTRDITERKEGEAAVRESEERFTGAFEHGPIGVAFVAPDGHWLKVNQALCDLVGYTEDELLRITFQDITNPEDLEPDLLQMHRLLDGEINSYQIEKRYVHKLGHLVSILLNVSLVRDDAGQPRYFISQIQDISARKQLEEQFRQSQKMEAVGVLAGGIAHDFNNLLTAITGYSDLTLNKMLPDDPLRRNIEEVKHAGVRAAELTSQLLAFSRKQVLKPIVLNLNSVLSNIENMLRRIIRESIDLRVVLDETLGNVKADPGQIEQVIMNLAVNARDAMPDGGTLTIETRNVYLDDDFVSQHIELAAGEFIKMTVTDTGHGMDAATRSRIFEPFFTTKAVGKGTGLGLSTVYGIVKQSDGDIIVYSEVGHGTTFKIYLPAVADTVQKPRWTGDRPQKYLGTETVLLVEDEDVVRHLVCEILTSNGYNVLEAANGKKALSICADYAETIDMLLTDVIMPGMSGGEIRDIVVKTRPDIRVLFMSGYTDDSVANLGVYNADSEFIEKPFTPEGLSRKVREVFEY